MRVAGHPIANAAAFHPDYPAAAPSDFLELRSCVGNVVRGVFT
jgi:hypothetical protein